jgi:hypothetical protein
MHCLLQPTFFVHSPIFFSPGRSLAGSTLFLPSQCQLLEARKTNNLATATEESNFIHQHSRSSWKLVTANELDE